MEPKTERFIAKKVYSEEITDLIINLNNPNEILNEFPDAEIIESGTLLQERQEPIINFTKFNFYYKNGSKKSFYIRNKNDCGECNICYTYDVLKKCDGCVFRICNRCHGSITQCPQNCGGRFI
jgi:hypothetical protein